MIRKDLSTNLKDISNKIDKLAKGLFFYFSDLSEDCNIKNKGEALNNEIIKHTVAINNNSTLLSMCSLDEIDNIRNLITYIGNDCYKAYKKALQLKKYLYRKDQDFECALCEFRSMMRLCRELIKNYKMIANENSLQSLANKISTQADSLLNDLDKVEDSCFLHNVKFTHMDIIFLVTKISDYAYQFAKDINTESEDVVEMRLYLQNMQRYIVNIEILIEELKIACLDENNENIYPNIKEKIDVLSKDIERLDQDYA